MPDLPPRKPPARRSPPKKPGTTAPRPRAKPAEGRPRKSGDGPATPPRPRKPSAPRSSTGGRGRRPPPRRKGPGILAGLLLAGILGVAVWLWWGLFWTLNIPGEGYRLRIERGAGYQFAFDRLQADGMIHDAWLARLYFRFQHPRPLQAGVYLFKPELRIAGLLAQLARGEGLIVNRITVIEGTTVARLREQLATNKDVQQTLQGKSDLAILSEIGGNAGALEGLFAPDTYTFMPGDSDIFILKRLYDRQQQILQRAWETRTPGLPYSNPYEALIMASIVEKETANAAERPQIAGVFVRRLQKGMRLQTDPTVIYGLGSRYTGSLHKADLLAYTPYNTYRINGLPPTPIALPSRAAIEAALHPAPGDALYFVARGDGSGRHVFSADLTAHNKAVDAYVQTLRAKP